MYYIIMMVDFKVAFNSYLQIIYKQYFYILLQYDNH